ncbi:MAG: hypothetical protein JO156_01025 [Solirubrobacterales bacterium]|nr:hypothetical protein [Solirubrobacterales bacterium]
MQRVLILGRGGAGKSTLAYRLGSLTGLPVIELDRLFWQRGGEATPRDQWAAIQHDLIRREQWIIDGDLGPHDVLEPRLALADTVIVLNFSLLRCAWRSVRRSREAADYWRWVIAYRRRSVPILMEAIATHAPAARVYLFRNPRAARAFVRAISPAQR